MIDNILEDKQKARIIIVLALVLFVIGIMLSFASLHKVQVVQDECNKHWLRQVEQRNPAFTFPNDLPVVFNFTKDYVNK